MKKHKVIGVQEKAGEYQGHEYHNVLLHTTTTADNALGEVTEVIKVKYNDVPEVFNKVMKSEDWQNLIGNEISVMYDRYGRTADIQIHEQKQNGGK